MGGIVDANLKERKQEVGFLLFLFAKISIIAITNRYGDVFIHPMLGLI